VRRTHRNARTGGALNDFASLAEGWRRNGGGEVAAATSDGAAPIGS